MLVANNQPEFINDEHKELAKLRVQASEAVIKAGMKKITDRLHKQSRRNDGEELVTESEDEEVK